MENIDAIKANIDTAINKKLSPNTLNRIAKLVEAEIPLMIFERLNKGIDAKGKKIRPLSIDYAAWKRRYIRGTLVHRKKSLNKRWLKALNDTTEYKAKSTPNFGRVTGKTLASLIATCIATLEGTDVVLDIKLKSDAEPQQLIIEGLKGINRDYYGILAPKTTATGRNERKRLKEIILKAIP